LGIPVNAKRKNDSKYFLEPENDTKQPLFELEVKFNLENKFHFQELIKTIKVSILDETRMK